MKLRRIALLGLLIAGLLHTAGSTALAGDFDRRGFYLGVNGVYGFDLFADELQQAVGATTGPIQIGNSPGINARMGYRIFNWIAIEAQYEWLHELPLDVNPGNGFINAGHFKPHTLTGNLRLFLPIWRIQPYLLAGAGIGIWEFEGAGPAQGIKVDGTGFSGRLGLGADIYLTKSWALNAEGSGVLSTRELKLPTGASFDQLYYFSLSAGLTYRF